MKKKLALIVLFFFIIIYFLSSYSFAYTDVSIKQDALFYTEREIDLIKHYLQDFSSLAELRDYINNRFNVSMSMSNMSYFAIVPRTDVFQYDLVFYRLSDVQQGSSINYYGMALDSFDAGSCYYLRFSVTDSYENHIQGFSSLTSYAGLPSTYYNMRTALIFTDDNTAILSTLNENVENMSNSVDEQVETTKETQNFIMSDKETSDNTINDFTNDINVDTVDSSTSTDIFELFGIIDSQDNVQTTDIPISFSFMNMNISFTINKYLTSNLLSSVFGISGSNIITNAIRLIWTYFIFIFIAKNILSLIDKIKAGEIDKINTKNVIVDVL